MRLGRVFDYEESVLAAKGQDRIHVRNLSEKMHRNNGLGSGSASLFQQGRVHRVSALIDIDKYRPGPGISDRFGRGHKGVGHCDDLVTRSNPASEQSEPKRVCAIAHTDGISRVAEGRELILELRDERSTGKSTAVDDFADGLIELSAKRSVMRLKIEKWLLFRALFLLDFREDLSRISRDGRARWNVFRQNAAGSDQSGLSHGD